MSAYTAVLPAQAAAGADVTTLLGAIQTTVDQETAVERVVLIPPAGFATVTGQATNNATITVRQLRAGAVVASFAALTTAAGTNLVAETPLQLVLSGLGGQGGSGGTRLAFVEDDVLDVVQHQNGTGQAIGAGIVVEAEFAGTDATTGGLVGGGDGRPLGTH